MPATVSLAVGFVASLLIPSTLAKPCPPLGPVLPPPRSPSGSDAVKNAAQELTDFLETQLTADYKTSGVSIGVKSTHEDEQLFSYHFTPPMRSGIGTNSIDEQTIYRVGSLSKLFPALAILQNPSVGMDDSVVKYIPELQDAKGGINWEEVTIGAMMEHLSGIATDTSMDLGIFPAPWTDLGLPEIPKGTGPNCSGLPGTEPCTAKDLLTAMNSISPVFPSYTSPSYSNLAYALLGMVVEAATNSTFEDVVQGNIFDIVEMSSSSFNGPVESFETRGFVPRGEPTWNLTAGIYESTGGMFSNTVDILAFGDAILTNKLLSTVQTRKWLKPASHTSSWGMSIGAPWEIMRSDNITSDKRIVDVYTKSGDLGLYHAMLALIPDYDIVISILTGGAEVSYTPFLNVVIKGLVPAIEQAGREEVSSENGLTGTYVDHESNSNLTLSLDDGPGLVIDSFNVRGFDVMHHVSSYSSGAVMGETFPPPADEYVDGRLYPTNITGEQGPDGTNQTAWRAVFETTPPEQRAAMDTMGFNKDQSCMSWASLDRSAYNFASLWEFRFVLDNDGSVEGIRNDAFDINLTKASSGTNPEPDPSEESGATGVRSGLLAITVGITSTALALYISLIGGL